MSSRREAAPALFWVCTTLGFFIAQYAPSPPPITLVAGSLILLAVWMIAGIGLWSVRKAHLEERSQSEAPLGVLGRLSADVATVLGAGWSKKAPGTIGSVAALPLAFALSHLHPWLRLGGAAIILLLSTWAVHHYIRVARRQEDPQEVVVDELVGVLLAMAFVPWSLLTAVAGFGLFRLFDIWKPGPVGWLDRNVGGAWGVMLDDVAAGLLAGGLLYGLVRGLG
jgi:phosphatidylglycerophosphatase A